MGGLAKKLERLLNVACAENGSNTSDFILADYLIGCLNVFDIAVSARERWYGREASTWAPAVAPLTACDPPYPSSVTPVALLPDSLLDAA
jgi:hypothetical protein